MNPKRIGGSVWLLLFGTASILLIGAFARFDVSAQPDGTAAGAAASPSTAASPDNSAPAAAGPVTSGGVPSLPLDLSPGLAEIIKLAQAHIGNDTILAYIQNSGKAYSPSADEILYLSDLGVSDKVVAALVNKPEPAVAPAAAPAPVPENMLDMAAAPSAVATAPLPGGQPPYTSYSTYSTYSTYPAAPTPPPVAEEPAPLQNPQDSYFYASLAPYGNWVQTPDGWCWQPMAGAVDSGWMPYRDRGQWMLTDDGWYWASDYSWGWAPFHYGRWAYDPPYGWVWIPGNDWAPAWVAWITTEGFAGWAALPPGVHYKPGVGLFSVAGEGARNAAYGLKAAAFTFVAQQHFVSRNVGRYAAPASQAATLFAGGKPVNNYSFAGGRIINMGVTAAQIAAATQAPVPKFTINEASSPDAAGAKGGGGSLAVFRPNVTAPAAGSSIKPPTSAVFINKTPHPGAPDASVSRTIARGPASASPDYSVQAARPNNAASRSILVGGNNTGSQGASSANLSQGSFQATAQSPAQGLQKASR